MNAKGFIEVQRHFGSFDTYIWQFVNHTPVQNARERMGDIPSSSKESDAMSKDLRKRGFKFVGTTICYAFMQATGMVNDHVVDCFRYAGLYRCVSPSCAREETPESRGMPCLFLNTERGFGGKPPKKSGFRRHLAGSKMPKETFFTAISRWRVVSRRALDASGFWQG